MPSALQNPLTLWLLLTAALAGLVYAFMRPELRTKAILYGAFLLACGVAVWPPYDTGETPGRIHLGLDLRGGIHLVLQVVVEDALNATVDDATPAPAAPLSTRVALAAPTVSVGASLAPIIGNLNSVQEDVRPAASRTETLNRSSH